MKLIPLSTTGIHKGKHFAQVDDEDFEYLNQFKWHRQDNKTTYYARRTLWINGKTKTESLHRFIFNIKDPKIFVDHKDGNGLNCQRENMRICSCLENLRNKKTFSKSGFKGVYVGQGRVRASIRIGDKTMYLGRFNTEIEAAIAYNEAAIIHHGEFAKLNIIK